jgi:hypothetical protein
LSFDWFKMSHEEEKLPKDFEVFETSKINSQEHLVKPIISEPTNVTTEKPENIENLSPNDPNHLSLQLSTRSSYESTTEEEEEQRQSEQKKNQKLNISVSITSNETHEVFHLLSSVKNKI